MGNILTTLKRFLANKNTVTILGILLGVGVIYFGYNYQIKKAITTISIPVAKQTITATSKITTDMITTTEVLQSFVSSTKNVITQYGGIINQTSPMCLNYGTSVPAGGFFYTEQIIECSKMSRNVFANMPDGYKPFALTVDLHKTVGNTMYPGDRIDLFVRMDDGSGKFIYGKLISSIEIADVVDSSGKSVFLTPEGGIPAELLFTVPESLYLLLSKARIAGVEITPVAGNASYTQNPGDTSVASEYLKSKILDKASAIPDEVVAQ